jgi:ABC-type transport system involved in multi-copper enzyme maturation permease subunit
MIGVIAVTTFREATRDRLWVVLLLFGLALLAGNRILTPIALGQGPRITVDLGLSALSLLGLLMTVVVGGSLVQQEIERRSIHVVLARPVARSTYLVGKWLGLSAMLWSTGLLMGAGLAVVAWQVQGPDAFFPVAQAVLLACLSYLVLCSLAIFFSSLSTPLLSSLYTLGLYGAGWWVADIRSVADRLGPPLGSVLHGAASIVPNLEIFNGRFAVAHLELLPAATLLIAAGYAIAYSVAVLALAAIAFEAREFK